MLIFSQDRKHIINSDQFDYFEIIIRGDGYWNEIFAENSDNSILLGKYITEAQAKDVFEHIAQSHGAVTTFYMPKEETKDE